MAKFLGGQNQLGSASIGLSVSSPSKAASSQDQVARPVGAVPGKENQGAAASPAPSDSGARTLVVGREIVLSGEVRSCNRLVVGGTIKANIKECRNIAIAEGGLFSGSAAVESAEISGRFEGELKVTGRLLIRAPGVVSGTLQYNEIEIERGGRIAGDVAATGNPDRRIANA